MIFESFEIFKNALRQFIPNRAPKHVTLVKYFLENFRTSLNHQQAVAYLKLEIACLEITQQYKIFR